MGREQRTKHARKIASSAVLAALAREISPDESQEIILRNEPHLSIEPVIEAAPTYGPVRKRGKGKIRKY